MRTLFLVVLLSACSDYNFHDDKVRSPPGDSASGSTTAPPPDSAVPSPGDSGGSTARSCDGFEPPGAPTVEVNDACLREPDIGTLDPVVEWSSRDDLGYASDPDRSHTYIMPAVGQLTDDNGDGLIDTNDVPDIAWSVYNNSNQGGLRVASGDGSAEHLYIRGVTWGGTDCSQ